MEAKKIKKNEEKKINVFFRRVNTPVQSFESQTAADNIFRDKLSNEKYIEVNEICVSGDKRSIKDREKMSEVLSLIKQDLVDTIYLYDRTRLTRKSDEYLEIVDLLLTHNVNVVFTSKCTTPFGKNIVIECLYANMLDYEQKVISKRAKDSYRKRRE